jgi:alpha-beta hydrolase superfamily lysophospholipase
MTVQQDILGPGFTARTLHLARGNVATLVHHSAGPDTRGAVLYLHGFVDYFFHAPLARFLARQGWDIYALDLRRYGRSLRDGDIPWFTTHLDEYHEELDLAVRIIREAGHQRVVAMGHSTGGLILPLWLADRRDPHPVDGLLLNSPWLDLQYNWFNRTIGTQAIDVVGRIRPLAPLPQKLNAVYPRSLHCSHHGEWEFREDWKPLTAVPAHAGWFRSIRRGHARLQKGLNLQLPILLMRSDKSIIDPKEWSPEVMKADIVLDVGQMQRWAPALGRDVTMTVIPDGIHDLVLSPGPVRERVLAELGAWLDGTFRE